MPLAPEVSPSRTPSYGPWLVGLGAFLWGTESAWRIPLNGLLDADVIVFWEHVAILAMFLPILLPRLGDIRKITARSWAFLIFSGIAGSAVGTIFFTLALKHGNPVVVNVIPNIQPVFSTIGAYALFHDRLAKRFFLWAPLAIAAGVFLSVEHPGDLSSFAHAGLNVGAMYAAICAVCWGLSTVAGRGVMTHVDLKLASSLRIVIGLVCMTIILVAYGKLDGAMLFPAAARAHATKSITLMLLLASISGGIPLLIYFEGLKLTRASTAGYFEMLQTLAGACTGYAASKYWEGAASQAHLYWNQLAAGAFLVLAVTMVQRAQSRVELALA